MRVAILALILIVSGCASSAHLHTAESSHGALPGQSNIGGSVEVRTASGTAASFLFALGLLSILADDAAHGPIARQFPLDPHRSVHEQDCTRPIEIGGGNLRCR